MPKGATTETGEDASGGSPPSLTDRVSFFSDRFSDAFSPSEQEDGSTRYVVRRDTKGGGDGASSSSSSSPLRRLRRLLDGESGTVVVKVAGKNGLAAKDGAEFNVDTFREVQHEVESAVLRLSDRPLSDMVLVFDGDNYEPETAPFSVLLRSLAPRVSRVLAVKRKAGEKGYSKAFVEGWRGVDNAGFVEVEEDPNDWNERRSGYVLNVYSSKFPFRPDGVTKTTGFVQLEAQRRVADHVEDVADGVELVHLGVRIPTPLRTDHDDDSSFPPWHAPLLVASTALVGSFLLLLFRRG